MLSVRRGMIDVARGSSVALVIDASESALPHRAEILKVAVELIRELPPSSKAKAVFLGSREVYPAERLAAGAPALYDRHRDRVSVVAPVVDALEATEADVVIVLHAGAIYDLDDWAGTPFAERLLLVSFSGPRAGGGPVAECGPSVAEILGAGKVQARIGTPIGAEVSGPGAMPCFWDNPAYRWENGVLRAHGAPDLRTHVEFLCPKESEIVVNALLPGGGTRAEELRRVDWKPEREWLALSAEETRVFREAAETGRYRCPHCKGTHLSRELRCPDDPRSLLGRPVYAFLEALSEGGFALARERGDAVEVSRHPCQALRVGAGSVAIRTGAGARVYDFDRGERAWRQRDHGLEQYHRLDDGGHVVFI